MSRAPIFGSQLFVLCLLIFWVGGCGRVSDSSSTASQGNPGSEYTDKVINQFCIVYLRYDALGTASDSPMNSLTEVMNGASVAIRGTLRNLDGEWIIIDQEYEPLKRSLWIPKSCVLSIAFDYSKEAPTPDISHGSHGEH